MINKGCIYWDESSRGAHSNLARTPYVRGRWVGEKTVNGKRVRMRSTDYNKVLRFLGREPKKDEMVLNGLIPVKSHPDYFVDVTSAKVFSYKHGKLHEMKQRTTPQGHKWVEMHTNGKKSSISVNRLMYAALHGIDVDVMPKDIVVRCSEERGYYLEYRENVVMQNRRKQTIITATIERNIRESELMLGYYTNGEVMKVTEYVLGLGERLKRYATGLFHCTPDRAKFLADCSIDKFLSCLKDGSLHSTSITGTLRGYVRVAYKMQAITKPYIEN